MSAQIRPDGVKFSGNDAIQTKPVITVDNQSPSSNGDVPLDLTSINNRISIIQSRINDLKN
tara:strand:+ start:4448 stop:4630 length:183 start_codon:yes stop_codon:yes gene_type:complete